MAGLFPSKNAKKVEACRFVLSLLPKPLDGEYIDLLMAWKRWSVWLVFFGKRIEGKLAPATVVNLMANISYANVQHHAALPGSKCLSPGTGALRTKALT